MSSASIIKMNLNSTMMSMMPSSYQSIDNDYQEHQQEQDDNDVERESAATTTESSSASSSATTAGFLHQEEDYYYHHHTNHQKDMNFRLLVVLMSSVLMVGLLHGYQESIKSDSATTTSQVTVTPGNNMMIPLLGDSATHVEYGSLEPNQGSSRSSSRSWPSWFSSGGGSNNNNDDIVLPYGVNFASWLSLEDYFYVGAEGAVEVATPDTNTVGTCLPPLHVGQPLAPKWNSETDLLANLIKVTGVTNALRVIHAHRVSYYTESDLQDLQALGVKYIRIPLSWCFTNHNIEEELTDEASDDDELLQKFTCEDPFYKDEGIRWPAIPRKLLVDFLKLCSKYNIQASLDLHTYPGATSPGTFSGLWPKQPRFWFHDLPENPTEDIGRKLYVNFIKFIEDLPSDALDGILGISPMNEPAHLAGVFYNNPDRDYLPGLSTDLAQQYLNELGRTPYIPDGPHLQVLYWLKDSVEVFRGSSLPSKGLQLHVNVHESLLIDDLLYDNDGGDYEGRGNLAAHKLIANWWSLTTSPEERSAWAVLDMHHYHAWTPQCLGSVDGTGNYMCNNVEERDEALSRCTEWATHIFRSAVDEFCGSGAKLMSGEFSTSTNHRVRKACNDMETIRESYKKQMDAAIAANINMFYWSFKMPYGGAFKQAWSFKQLAYDLGLSPGSENNKPDTSIFHCGGHIPQPGEVSDDYFVPDDAVKAECLSCQ